MLSLLVMAAPSALLDVPRIEAVNLAVIAPAAKVDHRTAIIGNALYLA